MYTVQPSLLHAGLSVTKTNYQLYVKEFIVKK